MWYKGVWIGSMPPTEINLTRRDISSNGPPFSFDTLELTSYEDFLSSRNGIEKNNLKFDIWIDTSIIPFRIKTTCFDVEEYEYYMTRNNIDDPSITRMLFMEFYLYHTITIIDPEPSYYIFRDFSCITFCFDVGRPLPEQFSEFADIESYDIIQKTLYEKYYRPIKNNEIILFTFDYTILQWKEEKNKFVNIVNFNCGPEYELT